MPLDPRLMAAAPIVGLPYQTLNWYPTQNIICKCKEGNMFFLTITGFGIPVICTNCGRRYHIDGMTATGQPVIIMEQPIAELTPGHV